MFARISWSQLPAAGREQLESGGSFYRERILTSLQTQKGFLGSVVLANPETGEGASVTYWETAEAMAASEAMGAAGRVEASQNQGIIITDVDRFELMLQDRAAPPQAGTFVRLNDVPASIAQMEAAVNWMRDTGAAQVRAQNGFRALLVFGNRVTGRMLIASSWGTAADRQASEGVISGLRSQLLSVAQSQAASPKITLYETVLAEVSQAAQQATAATAVAR